MRWLERPEVAVVERALERVGGDELVSKWREAAYTYHRQAKGEFYTMVQHQHLGLAVSLIDQTKQPHLNLRAFCYLLEYVEPETNRITIGYKELAELLGCSGPAASTAMNDLARCNLLIRFQRGRTPRYHWNPRVAYVGPIDLRKKHAEAAPQLAMPV